MSVQDILKHYDAPLLPLIFIDYHEWQCINGTLKTVSDTYQQYRYSTNVRLTAQLRSIPIEGEAEAMQDIIINAIDDWYPDCDECHNIQMELIQSHVQGELIIITYKLSYQC